MKRQLSAFLFSSLLILIAACSGGGGGVGPLADGGIGGTGISLGNISAFGSVVVNGKKFEITDTTQIIVDGQPSSEQDLKVGYVVRLQGDFVNPIAEKIEFAESVRGPIESITINDLDALQATINLLGQTVVTNTLTNLSNLDLSTLSPGDIIATSGNRDAQGSLIASFIERKTSSTELRVMGPISNLDATTLNISNLLVDFSNANLTKDSLQDGKFIRVKGSSTDFTSSPPTLKANTVEPGISLSANTDDAVELEGIVTDFATIGNFKVSGQEVDASLANIENGNVIDVKNNVRVEVEGSIDENDVLQAIKVDIKPDSPIRIDANVESLNVSDNLLALLGVSVGVNDFTQFEDKSDADLRTFSMADISVGDRISIRGFIDGNNVIASRLEREDLTPDPDDDAELQAPLEANNATTGTVTLLGITVSATTALGTEFENESDSPISQAEFYSVLETGTLVKVKWDPFTSTANPADEISLEND